MAKSQRLIVVGGGLAGLMTTLRACEMGMEVDLFSVVPVKRSHSVCAQGGINGAVNTKGKKVKKPSDSAKIRELKEQIQLADQNIMRLCISLSEQEDEIEQLQQKAHRLEIIVIEQRGAIGYLEHKLEKKGTEDESN